MVVAMFQCYSLNLSLPLLQLSSQVLPLHLGIYSVQFSSFQWLSRVWLYATPWTTARQTSLSITNSWSLPKLMSIELVMPSNHLILSPPFPPAFNLSQHQGLLAHGQNIGVSASTSVLPMNTQDWFPLGWTGWISCSSRDSQESSPTPQFKSINSVLSIFYSPTLTSIHNY